MNDNSYKVIEIDINEILPNRFQPRIQFDEEEILELSDSIKEHGVIQPLVVRTIGDKYEIIAGERRYKASVLAGKETVPVIIKNLNDKDSAEIALIENIQRKNLTPIEEALSYKKILDMGYLTQESLAIKLGKSQSTIANKIRLLNLSDEVQEALLDNKISERHARSLLRLKSFNDQNEMLDNIIQKRLTVRKTDEEIDKVLNIVKEENLKEEEKEVEIMNPEINQIPTVVTPTPNSNFDIFSVPAQTPAPAVMPAAPVVEPAAIPAVPAMAPIVEPAAIPAAIPVVPAMAPIVEPAAIPAVPAMAPIVEPAVMPVSPVVEPAAIPAVPAMAPIVEPAAIPAVPAMAPIVEPAAIPAVPAMAPIVEPAVMPVSPVVEPAAIPAVPAMAPIVEPTVMPAAPVAAPSIQFDANGNVISMGEVGVPTMPVSPVVEPAAIPAVPAMAPIVESTVMPAAPVAAPSIQFDANGNVISMGEVGVSTMPVAPVVETPAINANPVIPSTIAEPINVDPIIITDYNKQYDPIMPSVNVPVISKVDFKEIINAIRECSAKIEKYGYKIDVEEYDLSTLYQVVFKIEK